jgi:hypothetical protein
MQHRPSSISTDPVNGKATFVDVVGTNAAVWDIAAGVET